MDISILESGRICREHPKAAVAGGLIGCLPPITAYVIMHGALTGLPHWHLAALGVVLIACLAFSVQTVWMWGHGSFGEKWKATFLVVSLEGCMAFMLERYAWLAVVALAYLICINAVATACHLVSQDAKPKPLPARVPAVSAPLLSPRRSRAAVPT